MLQSSDQFLLPELLRAEFLTFCTFYWLGRCPMDPSGHPEHPRSGRYGQQGAFFVPDLSTLFFRAQKWAKMVDFGGFLDLIQILMPAMGSNLFQIDQNTSPDHYEATI